MATKVKIKIKDDTGLRNVLDAGYELSSQIKLCKYALLLAKHILDLVEYEYTDNSIIQAGFRTNEE